VALLSHIEEIQTPALVLNIDALRRNVERMAEQCRGANMALRPHTKTHKSPWVAMQQMRAGAVGICTAKVGEAEVMAKAGIGDILITTEPVPNKMDRILDIASMARITIVLDAQDCAAEFGRRATRRGVEVPALVDVNVGQNRAGTDPGRPALELARHIADTQGLRFAGLQGYEGHCQHIVNQTEQRARAFECYERLRMTRDVLVEGGIQVPWVTTAGTGTYRFAKEHGLATEVQPGSYVVMDSVYSAVESTNFENALFVLSSIVSLNRKETVIIDAGWKAISIDGGMPVVKDQPEARYAPAGDEHGRVTGLSGNLKPGDAVWLVPSHCDTTINLYDSYHLMQDDGRFQGTLAVAGRGKSA